MNDNEFQFHMEEFRALQSERNSVLNRGWNLLQYAFIFSFAFYGWILATGDGDSDSRMHSFSDGQWNVVVWIPFVTSVVSLIFSYGLYKRIVQISNYIIRLEELLAAHNLGWERRVREENLAVGASVLGKRTAPTTIYIGISWLVLIALTLVAGIVFSR
jgi:hypothetical protein